MTKAEKLVLENALQALALASSNAMDAARNTEFFNDVQTIDTSIDDLVSALEDLPVDESLK